ncbi:MAG: MFS transporter, partial [Planctomycetota bacterium]|nr:MFS transporter [Planctomycetota bacterium]
MMDRHPESPTRIRYLIVSVAFLSALLLYLHRFCITYAQRFIKEDLGLTNDQLSYCFSAFFVAYALGQVPSGWLSDRFGARWMLTTYIIVWSGFTALVGLTTGFVMFLLLRAAVGLGQAGAYPTSAALVARWVPTSARGKASSCVAFGGRVGGFMAPIVTVYMVIAFVPKDEGLLEDGDLMTRGLGVELQATSYVQSARIKAQDQAASEAPNSDRSVLGEEPDQLAANLARFRVRSLLDPESLDAASHVVPIEVRERQTPPPSGDADTLFQHIKQLQKRTEDLGTAAANSETPAHRMTLRTDLNRLLERTDLWDALDIDLMPLEREAKQLRRQTSRTQQETIRLNRLVLEAAFPNGIKKLYVRGWRKVMFVYGAAGLAVACVFWWVFRERPKEHPWCNSAEQQLVDRDRPVGNTDLATGGIPLRAIVRSRNLWLMCGSQFCSNIGWVFLMTW